jgi:hypothetical protein
MHLMLLVNEFPLQNDAPKKRKKPKQSNTGGVQLRRLTHQRVIQALGRITLYIVIRDFDI